MMDQQSRSHLPYLIHLLLADSLHFAMVVYELLLSNWAVSNPGMLFCRFFPSDEVGLFLGVSFKNAILFSISPYDFFHLWEM